MIPLFPSLTDHLPYGFVSHSLDLCIATGAQRASNRKYRSVVVVRTRISVGLLSFRGSRLAEPCLDSVETGK